MLFQRENKIFKKNYFGRVMACKCTLPICKNKNKKSYVIMTNDVREIHDNYLINLNGKIMFYAFNNM